MAAKPIPDGFHSLTPYLILTGAARAIDFYKSVFGATEIARFADPSGRVGHAELKIGDSVLMLSDEYGEMGYKSPQTVGAASSLTHVYVPDVDATFARATQAGAQVMKPVKDEFYGDRTGSFRDPFGHLWTVATHVEDVSRDEMKRRMDALTKQAGV